MKGYTIIIGVVAVTIVVALWAVNVRTANAPSPQAVATSTATTVPPATDTLSIGASATIHGTTIKVLGLAEDSRCPVDVQCIQAGTVRVRASINSSTNDVIFTLSQPQVVGSATITLSAVIPAQKYAGQTVQLNDYRFTFTVVSKADGGKACTMEAKLCPDGSAVGRTGPNCEFTPCPTHNSGVRGTVLLGPTCPVMRDPPDPQCADKGYATAITVYRTGSSAPLIIGNSDASGAFEFSLAPGSYTLSASGGTMLPRCNPADVTVVAGAYATTTISCDTGIR